MTDLGISPQDGSPRPSRGVWVERIEAAAGQPGVWFATDGPCGTSPSHVMDVAENMGHSVDATSRDGRLWFRVMPL